ncbi:MAG: hypothetical protein ABSD88_14590 [Candidatus Korobacteraceae bacterium]|jgi:hypothetical protein
MFENTVAFAGGVGSTDAAAPAVAPDVGASVDDTGLLCEEEFPALVLPPQPAKYIDDANIKPTRILRTTTLLIQDLPRSPYVNREYGAI